MGLISCRKIVKRFGGIHALAHVDMEFERGTITAIIGPNGAGKSTLVDVVTGFVRADAGVCTLDGADITRASVVRRVALGVSRTFQRPRLVWNATVLENVLLGIKHPRGENLLRTLTGYGVADEAAGGIAVADEVIKRFGFDVDVRCEARQLSYGQQKVLGVIIACAGDARALLLDEPVAGLGPELRAAVLRVLKDASKAGRAIVFVEHDFGAVAEMADKVYLMNEGMVVASGAPSELLVGEELLSAYLPK